MQDVLIATTVLGVGLLLFEVLARKLSLSPPASRKLLHVGMAACVILVSSHVPYRHFVVVSIIFFVLLMLLRRKRLLHTLSYRADSSYGDLFFPLGIGTAAVLAENAPAFMVTVAVLGLADTAAFIVGRTIAGPRLYRTKTISGWVACAVVTATLLTITGYGWRIAVVGSCIIATTELFSLRGSDNLTVPVACALLLAVLA